MATEKGKIDRLARLSDLEERQKKLTQQREALARKERLLKKAVSAKKRSQETKRKILAGAWVLEQAEQNEEARKKLFAGLDKFLTRDRDREVFPELEQKGE